jgi:hypothetical protein
MIRKFYGTKICILYKVFLYKKNYTPKFTNIFLKFTFVWDYRDGCRAWNCAAHSKHLEASSSVLGGDVGDEVADTAGVTPLVVVPGDELDEVGVQRNAGVGVEDRRAVVTDEVGRDDLLIGVFDDALVCTLRGSLHDSLDFVIGSSLLSADNEIDDRDIEGGDTESETTVGRLAKELAVGDIILT